MRTFGMIIAMAAAVYTAYWVNENYIKPRTPEVASLAEPTEPAPAGPRPEPVALQQPDPAPMTTPAPAPVPLSAPAPDPAPAPANITSTLPPTPSAPSVIVLPTKVQAFDPKSPVTPLGWFKAGTTLEVSECATTGMKSVSFKDPSGRVIEAVCFEKDLNRTTEETTAENTAPKPVVEKPKPLTFKPKKWAGEPNWHSIYDDSGYQMMTDKNGQQK